MPKKLSFKLSFILAVICTSGVALASDDSYVEQMRETAAHKRMEMMERVQHTQANPGASWNEMENAGSGNGTATFKASSNGHFFIPASVNSHKVTFVADTGATNVLLTQADAKAIGIDVTNLKYDSSSVIANGQILKSASTTVNNFRVGPIMMGSQKVFVSSASGGMSLLGMSFFSRLKSYSVQNNVMTMVK